MSEVTQRPRSSSPKSLSPDQQEKRSKAAQAMKKRSQTQPGFFDKYSYHIVIGVFLFVCLFAVVSILTRNPKKQAGLPVIDEEEISAHNSQGLYEQGPNEFFQEWKLGETKVLFNNHFSFKNRISQCPESNDIIPETYNFREKFPNCVHPVYNQGNCSSSYSIATVTATSDRLCRNKEDFFFQLSPQSPISCDDKNYKCQGGSVTRVLDVGKQQGFVTTQCMPFKGVDEAVDDCTTKFQNCDRYKVQDYCVASGVEQIKREITTKGPVVVVIPVHKDFLVYKGGIYEVSEGAPKIPYGHAVKVVGWGSENGKNYWIIENSWGESWGIKGLAHIAIGQQLLDFEKYAVSPVLEIEQQVKTE
ncbi:hypothetical protein pb186bvf_000859 [Paramecium bursaria]